MPKPAEHDAAADIDNPSRKVVPAMRPRSDHYTDLCTLVRAYCWSEGLEAPVEWVHWLLDLEIDAAARRDGVSVEQAESMLPLDHATALGRMLVTTTRENARAVRDPGREWPRPC
ncbi:hypothetical protein [Solicola sp. PLA-1-18]|uniref:hypothetical protein n=1 Tax=Solicola sp. PLA-1-18 TaxID=3380532 RepID=UPI003B7BD5DA